MVIGEATDSENHPVQSNNYHQIDNEIVVQPDRSLGVRHFQALLLFLSLVCSVTMQLCLLPVLVAIIDPNPKNPNSQLTSYFAEHYQYSNSIQGYDWNEKIKGYLLSTFLWGYILTKIPAGQLAEKYGAKAILLWSTVFSALTVSLMPLGIWYGGWQLLCVLQIILGVFQGFIFPSTNVLVAKWSPVSERVQLNTCIYSGIGFGIMTIFSSSGLLISTLGWPSVFYACGLAGGLWSMLWLFFGSSSPADCKYISANELRYIQISLEHHTGESSSEVQVLKTPWKHIFTSRAFYALLIVNLADHWVSSTLLKYLPSYLNGVLKFNIKENGFLSALSSLVNLILGFVFCFLSGFLERNNWLSLKYNRKMFNTIGQWIPALILTALGFLQENNTILAVVLITISSGMEASTYSGYWSNAIDIAPNFAGTLTGIVTTVSSAVCIFAPTFVGMVLKDDSDVIGWRIVFLTSAAIYFVGNLIFILFGSTKTQAWNTPANLSEN